LVWLHNELIYRSKISQY